MARGDQIYVMRPFMGLNGVYEHHGIDCGDGTVIHYSKAEDVATVRRTPLSVFTLNNPIFVKQQPVSFIADVVIERARSRLGEQNYNLISNNCEHFANWCKTGVSRSKQIEDYGLGVGGIGAYESGKLVDEAAQTGNVPQAIALFNQAEQNIAAARSQLLPEYNRMQKEMKSWHRVALATLRRGEDHLTRAALERKVSYKRRAAALKVQLDQLDQMEENLKRNRTVLDQRQHA